MSLHATTDRLVRRLRRLKFADPVAYVYDPLEYARASYDEYLRRYARPGCEAVFLGMNPGPWGMAQTGVPFGEVGMVRDWLAIRAPIQRPKRAHPKRPVLGLDCTRSEVSGARLWGWARDRFGTPGRFFERFFVANYCPLAFLEDTGRNRTPDKLPSAEREPLFAACDEALRAMIEHLRPKWVIGVGAFAEGRAKVALALSPVDQGGRAARYRRSKTGGEAATVTFGRILHPSPASPAANRGWQEQVESQLEEMGIRLPDRVVAKSAAVASARAKTVRGSRAKAGAHG
jgi:single-strand selective monofunctional uracil DNA glycosylase